VIARSARMGENGGSDIGTKFDAKILRYGLLKD